MLIGSRALAQDPAAPPDPTPAPAPSSAPGTPAPASAASVATPPLDGSEVPPPHDRPPPGASVGFQLALRTGFQVPFGQVAAGSNMGDNFSGQVPLVIDVGWKFIPQLFVGLYGSLGLGGTSGALSGACAALDLNCVTASLRLGLEALVYLAPSADIDPWVGYGIGIESTGFSASNGNQTVSEAVAGWEFAHFMAGVDFRLTKYICVGPLVDFSLGQYSSESTKDASGNTTNGSIAQQALHEWLLIGGRAVFYP
jgi:hypothetical protein